MYKAEILADSLSPQGHRITTMKITFPRFILAEMNTHRVFSRNSASSRAIPFNKMVKMVEENPFIPIAWQKDHKGMQGSKYQNDFENAQSKLNWNLARLQAMSQATQLHENGVTKQLCNRLLEPFMWHTVIVTATEWENFFNLRCPQYVISWYPENRPEATEPTEATFRSRKDAIKATKGNCYSIDDFSWFYSNESQADIHIQAIAELMWDAYNESTPKQLQAGEWHIPFGDNMRSEDIVNLTTKLSNKTHGDTGTAIIRKVQIATARCARISYTTLGDDPKIDYEADLRLHDILAKSGHWSPFEHVAIAMNDEEYISFWNGDRRVGYGEGWCRNFRGFIQYRHLIDG